MLRECSLNLVSAGPAKRDAHRGTYSLIVSNIGRELRRATDSRRPRKTHDRAKLATTARSRASAKASVREGVSANCLFIYNTQLIAARIGPL